MPTTVKLPIKPRELQEKILNNFARKQVVIAHRRFGKTTLSLLKLIKTLGQIPKSRVWYIAPTYRQAKNIAWRMLQALLPEALIHRKNEVELFIELTNGSLIELKGADKPDSLRGVGLDGCVLDEYALMYPNVWSQVIRPTLVDKQGWALFIGTPAGKNHLFDMYMGTKEEDRCLFKASETNIIAPEELAAAKLEMNEDEYKQEFECNFLYFSGQIYKEFDLDRHVIRKPFVIDKYWRQGLAIDHGQVNPTAGLFYATDFDGRIFIFDEYYEAGKTVKEHISNLKNLMTQRNITLHEIPIIDPSVFAKNRAKGDVLYSIADEYMDNGLHVLPAQNDVMGGINRVKEHFQSEKLFIFANCENLIRELQSYRWKDRKMLDKNLPEEPLKINDHAVDALRYIVLSRPFKPRWPKFKNPLEERYKELTKPAAYASDWYNE